MGATRSLHGLSGFLVQSNLSTESSGTAFQAGQRLRGLHHASLFDAGHILWESFWQQIRIGLVDIDSDLRRLMGGLDRIERGGVRGICLKQNRLESMRDVRYVSF